MVVWPTDEDPTSRDSSNHPTVLESKDSGVERHGEKSQKMTQVAVKELNASEPSMRCRKETMIRKLGWPLGPEDKCVDCQTGRSCPHRIRHRDGRTFMEALSWNRRSHRICKTGRHKWSPHEAERRDGSDGGRWSRSSVEGSVMDLERRAPRSGEHWLGNSLRG